MDTEQVSPQHTVEGGAWKWDRQRLTLVIGASAALLALVALVAAIELPDRNEDEQEQSQPGSGEGEFGQGGLGQGRFGEGANGSGRIDIGDGSGLEVRPIPGCPNGFALGDDILVIPDPEACGYQLVPPGAQGFDPSGKRILVPDIDGDIGGFRVGPDGEIDLLAPGEVGGGNDIVVGQFPDGSFGLFRPDGTWVEITPGDDGLSLRDPLGGDSFFIPRDGQDPGSIFEDPGAPNAQDPSRQDDAFNQDRDDRFDNNDDRDSSLGNTLLWVLLGLVGLGLVALIAKGLSDRDPTATDDDEDTEDDGVQDTAVDYSAELNALDRMLWEIGQEPDPRIAINRVYAALETGLGNPDMARRRSETPGIYLRRVLGRFDELHGPLSDLTDLFQQARFSEHEITFEMRDWAVQTLVNVRTHFERAAAQTAQAEPALR